MKIIFIFEAKLRLKSPLLHLTSKAYYKVKLRIQPKPMFTIHCRLTIIKPNPTTMRNCTRRFLAKPDYLEIAAGNQNSYYLVEMCISARQCV